MTREEIIRLKKKKSLSVIKLSELSGVPAGTITKIISGETKKPRKDTLDSLKKVLLDDMTPGDLNPDDSEENLHKTYLPSNGTSGMLCERAVSYGAPAKKQGEYTFADLNCLPEGRYAELIDGYIYDMATPSYLHQMTAMEIYDQIRDFIRREKGNCEVFVNAFGIFADNDENTYLIPDLSIVCDRNKVKNDGIYGAPDFVLEILSPSTAVKDRVHKFHKYAECGVREYWIIDTEKRRVTAYRMFGDYEHYIGPLVGKLDIAIYGGKLKIDLDKIDRIIRESQERFGG